MMFYLILKRGFQKVYIKLQGYVRSNEESEKKIFKRFSTPPTPTVLAATKHYLVPVSISNFFAMVIYVSTFSHFLSPDVNANQKLQYVNKNLCASKNK
jgi:hypothetical protein